MRNEEEARNKQLAAEMSRKIKRARPQSQRHILESAGIFPFKILHMHIQEEAEQPQENKKKSLARKKSKSDTIEAPAFGLK
jgi:hypothetical protein